MRVVMKKMIAVFALVVFGLAAHAQDNDKKLIEQAIHNYVDAFYQADTTKAYESIARDLAKRGYYTSKDGKLNEAKMSFEQLVRLAQRWKASQNITADSPKKITVFEVLDRIASAKVEAQWGIDYFHLAKRDGKWTIINVLWQEYPKAN